MIHGDSISCIRRRIENAKFERNRLIAGIPAPVPEPQRSEMIRLWAEEQHRLAARLRAMGAGS